MACDPDDDAAGPEAAGVTVFEHPATDANTAIAAVLGVPGVPGVRKPTGNQIAVGLVQGCVVDVAV